MTLSQRASQSPFRQQRWIECLNYETSRLDPYSVVEISEATRPESGTDETPQGGRTVLTVKIATADSKPNTAVLGPLAVTESGYGICTMDFPAYVKVQAGTPANGETWGVKSGETGIRKDYQNFLILGDYDATLGIVRVMRLTKADSLVELCLKEDHPGRGALFDAYVGVWNATTHAWDYTCESTVKAVDWRYDTPYPQAGARGLFVARESALYGTVYECVSLDCDTPGDCC